MKGKILKVRNQYIVYERQQYTESLGEVNERKEDTGKEPVMIDEEGD